MGKKEMDVRMKLTLPGKRAGAPPLNGLVYQSERSQLTIAVHRVDGERRSRFQRIQNVGAELASVTRFNCVTA